MTQQDPTEDNKPLTALLRRWLGPGEDAVDLALWFRGTPALDAALAAQFGDLHARAARGGLDHWADSPRGLVGLVVLLDQLSRNLHRGTAEMFAHDTTARRFARAALQHPLPPAQRAVAALCLTHAESPDVAAEGIAVLQALKVDPQTRGSRKAHKRLLHAARKRHRVLLRFARYPHRNALLGRETTHDEAAYLAEETSRFARSVQSHRPGRLKILVLHSFRQSGARLAARTRALKAAVSDIAELIFVDAPHTYVPDAAEQAMLEADFASVPDFSSQRCWWNSDDTHTVYTGWEDSIRSLKAHFPVDGVLGFSQGAALTGLLAALESAQLRFVICASGFPSRAAAHDMLTRPDSIDLPSLHIYGERDVLVDPARTLALAGCFVAPDIVSHPAGHFAPDRWPLDAVRSFLLRFTTPPQKPRPVLSSTAWADVVASKAPNHADIAALLPSSPDALAALLREAAGLRRDSRPHTALTAPRAGDAAHHIWLAAWAQAPAVVSAVLAEDTDFRGLVRLAELAGDDDLTEQIADRFATQLRADRDTPRPSLAAEAAPRTSSATDRETGLGRRIAVRLQPSVAPPGVYMAYRKQIVALSQKSRALRQPRRRPRHLEAPAGAPVSAEVLRPRPVPVVPCPLVELGPLLSHLDQKSIVAEEHAFPRGTVTPDGRLDLCKQVVGPAGIQPLLASLAAHPQVDRLLLGNNVIGSAGARAVADFIRSGESRLKVWYIAGNELHAEDLRPIAAALAGAPAVEGLWLKRNPLGPEAGPILAALLGHPRLRTLDLVNTGLLDAGALPIIAAAADSPALRNLYLGTNGLTTTTAAALGRMLAAGPVTSLFVSCNRLGDDGAKLLAAGLRQDDRLLRLGLASNRIGPAGATALARALHGHPSLLFLDLGWTRATSAVGEAGNRIGDDGARAIAEMLRENDTLQGLDISHNRISQAGLNAICDALADNRRLVFLRCPQFGKASNPDAMALLRGRVARNRALHGLSEVDAEEVRAPRAARAILSVYRTQPIG